MDEETEAPSGSEASPEARRAKKWWRWGWNLIVWLTAQQTATHVNRHCEFALFSPQLLLFYGQRAGETCADERREVELRDTPFLQMEKRSRLWAVLTKCSRTTGPSVCKY